MASESFRSPADCLVAAGLQTQILLPSDAKYAQRQDSFWSNSAKIRPACIVQPRTAEEVSTAVKALVSARQPFAVRSGGHTNWAGSNNIKGGVTIDLGLLNFTIYDAATETARIGPGNRWRDAYVELHKHGRVVAGGREGNVGVAGLLLGGGNTFFTAQRGFACDNVVEYEIVLADGRIIKANKADHGDLFQALKGGSNNFGIVTSFTMHAIPCDKVWGGMAIIPKTCEEEAIEAITVFTDNVVHNNKSNLVCMFTYLPDFKDIVIATMYAQVDGTEKPANYEKWLVLPTIAHSVKMTTVKDMAFEYNIPTHYHDIWFTGSFKNDKRIINKAVELHAQLVEDLKAFIPNGDFVTQCLFQPLPTILAERAVAAGGNVMGIERHQHNGVLLLAVAMVRTPDQEAFAYPRVKAWLEGVREFSATIEGGNLPWIYLNYADKAQKVFESYGADNVKKIKDAAAKYDPEGVFQTLVPGGFKISAVST